MDIVKGYEKDLDKVLEIAKEVKKYFRENNIPQWLNDYPSRNDFLLDIENDAFYLIKEEDNIIGFFAMFDYEITYEEIDGAWLSSDEYVVIHRLALDNKHRGKGLINKVFDVLKKKYKHIKIDTHQNNLVMKKCLINNGFKYCGNIKLLDGSPREAYEFI